MPQEEDRHDDRLDGTASDNSEPSSAAAVTAAKLVSLMAEEDMEPEKTMLALAFAACSQSYLVWLMIICRGGKENVASGG